MRNEIKNSDNRLKAVKSGIALSQVVPKPGAGYYVPDVESYFRGIDKILRKKELNEELTQDEEKSVNFFITEAAQAKKSNY